MDQGLQGLQSGMNALREAMPQIQGSMPANSPQLQHSIRQFQQGLQQYREGIDLYRAAMGQVEQQMRDIPGSGNMSGMQGVPGVNGIPGMGGTVPQTGGQQGPDPSSYGAIPPRERRPYQRGSQQRDSYRQARQPGSYRHERAEQFRRSGQEYESRQQEQQQADRNEPYNYCSQESSPDSQYRRYEPMQAAREAAARLQQAGACLRAGSSQPGVGRQFGELGERKRNPYRRHGSRRGGG